MDVLDNDAEFLGTNHHSMDAKGRVVLPSAHRELLQEGMVMTLGFDGCLNLQTEAAWQVTRKVLRGMNTSNPRERKFVRILTSNAERTTVDKQGRVTVPALHREYASLAKDVTIVGAETHVEIWNTEKWQAYYGGGVGELAELSSEFGARII